MASRAFLKPRSVQEPSQGAHSYLPVVRVLEADSAAGLEAAIAGGVQVESQDTTAYWVVESVQYSTAVVQTMLGGNPPIVRYSALLHATKILKI
jgi:hypothetical protein